VRKKEEKKEKMEKIEKRKKENKELEEEGGEKRCEVQKRIDDPQ